MSSMNFDKSQLSEFGHPVLLQVFDDGTTSRISGLAHNPRQKTSSKSTIDFTPGYRRYNPRRESQCSVFNTRVPTQKSFQKANPNLKHPYRRSLSLDQALTLRSATAKTGKRVEQLVELKAQKEAVIFKPFTGRLFLDPVHTHGSLGSRSR